MNKLELLKEKDEMLDRMIDKARGWRKNPIGDVVVVSLADVDRLVSMLEDLQMRCGNFLDDEEKMVDFRILSKDEFLASYSYLTEEEYDNTMMLMKGLV